jgi:hypothetical protein
VDFALAKVDDNTVLVHKTTNRQALIHTRINTDGIFEYKYTPVRDFTPGQPVEYITTGDPLGYLDNPTFCEKVDNIKDWLEEYHTGTEWLEATYKTEYPGCVDALARYLRWDGPVSKKSPTPSQPDIVLFANKKWVFEPELILEDRYHRPMGTRHGMAFREATNQCLFISGPGIRKSAVVEAPHRMVDIMPTVLEMMRMDPNESNMDGRPIREIWEGAE